MLSRLNDQQRAAVGLHLAGWTHADVGRAFGFSRSRAAQVVAGAAAALAAEDWPAPPPNPPGRPRRERTPDEELRERLVATWHALRGDGLPSDERERLESSCPSFAGRSKRPRSRHDRAGADDLDSLDLTAGRFGDRGDRPLAAGGRGGLHLARGRAADAGVRGPGGSEETEDGVSYQLKFDMANPSWDAGFDASATS